jgi:hypothetical protein|nr:MAG TPA: hypothetical protein [Caudoviricetes sp.]
MISFTIKGNLAGLNELIAANRSYRIKGNKLKRNNTDIVKAAIYEAGLIRNDGWKNVEGFKDRFDIDKDDPRVLVWVFESQGDD